MTKFQPKPMTDDEYAAYRGMICPNCRSKEIGCNTGGNWCEKCGSTWEDDFIVTGYCNLMSEDEDRLDRLGVTDVMENIMTEIGFKKEENKR